MRNIITKYETNNHIHKIQDHFDYIHNQYPEAKKRSLMLKLAKHNPKICAEIATTREKDIVSIYQQKVRKESYGYNRLMEQIVVMECIGLSHSHHRDLRNVINNTPHIGKNKSGETMLTYRCHPSEQYFASLMSLDQRKETVKIWQANHTEYSYKDRIYNINNELDSNHIGLVNPLAAIRDFIGIMTTSKVTFSHVTDHSQDYDDEELKSADRKCKPIILYFDSCPVQGLPGADNLMVITVQVAAWEGHARGNPRTLLPIAIGTGSDSSMESDTLIRIILKKLSKFGMLEAIETQDIFGRKSTIDVTNTPLIVKYTVHGRSLRSVNIISGYGRSICFLCDTQLQADGKGTNQLYHATTHASNKQLWQMMLFRWTNDKINGINGWEGFAIDITDLEQLTSATPIFRELIEQEMDKPMTGAHTFLSPVRYHFIKKKTDQIDAIEHELPKQFVDDKERIKWRHDQARILGIGVHDVLPERYYEFTPQALLHCGLRACDCITDKWAFERILFDRNPEAEMMYVRGVLTVASEKYMKKWKSVSMNKKIKFSVNGRKARFVLHSIRDICKVTADNIKGTSEQANYHRYFNAMYVIVGDAIAWGLERGYMDVNKYDLNHPIWMQMIKKGLELLEKLRRYAEWIITPTILALLGHVPFMLRDLRAFNIKYGCELTMRDMDDNVMELYNKTCKEYCKNHNDKSNDSLEAVFRSLIIQTVGTAEFGTSSFHTTKKQRQDLEHEPFIYPSPLDGFDQITKDIIQAVRSGEEHVPHISESMMSMKMKKIKEFCEDYDEDSNRFEKFMDQEQERLMDLKSKAKVKNKTTKNKKKRKRKDVDGISDPQNKNKNGYTKKRRMGIEKVKDALFDNDE